MSKDSKTYTWDEINEETGNKLRQYSDIHEFIADYKKRQKENGDEAHYFDPDTLKYFGNRLSDMRILKEIAYIVTEDERPKYKGKKHVGVPCYVISMLQKVTDEGSKRSRLKKYFNVETLDNESLVYGYCVVTETLQYK